MLEIVGPEHDDDEIERHVRLEADGQRLESILVTSLDRIVADGRTAGLPLFDNVPATAEPPPKDARPTPIRCEAMSAGAGERRHGAVGVGVSVAKNGANPGHGRVPPHD